MRLDGHADDTMRHPPSDADRRHEALLMVLDSSLKHLLVRVGVGGQQSQWRSPATSTSSSGRVRDVPRPAKRLNLSSVSWVRPGTRRRPDQTPQLRRRGAAALLGASLDVCAPHHQPSLEGKLMFLSVTTRSFHPQVRVGTQTDW